MDIESRGQVEDASPTRESGKAPPPVSPRIFCIYFPILVEIYINVLVKCVVIT